MTSRREFLRKGGTIIGIGLSLPVLASLLSSCEKDEIVNNSNTSSTAEFNINEFPALSTIGGTAAKSFPGKLGGNPVLIAKTGDNTFLTLSSICTHQGCTVGLPIAIGANFACPCHGAEFSTLDGSVKQKPADNTDILALQNLKNEFNPATNILKIMFI